LSTTNLPSPLFAKEGYYCSSLWQREVRRDFVKQYRHLSKTMMWHIYDFRFDKAAKIEADKFATGWLNISHGMAIFTGPDPRTPQTLSCRPLAGNLAIKSSPRVMGIEKTLCRPGPLTPPSPHWGEGKGEGDNFERIKCVCIIDACVQEGL
jgi:hypothetical protein